MAEKSIKVIRCPKCKTERETTANTSANCINPECKAAIWVPSNLVSGQIYQKPVGEKNEDALQPKKASAKTKVEKSPAAILTLDRADVLAASVLADALNKGELCVGAAEVAGSGDLVPVLCEVIEGLTVVHAILLTPASDTKFSIVNPVMTL